jgi:hypothetical protein
MEVWFHRKYLNIILAFYQENTVTKFKGLIKDDLIIRETFSYIRPSLLQCKSVLIRGVASFEGAIL